jgi:hypothetical protein
MYSVKNAVYVAIMQIGVIVAGVLAAGMWLKVRREMDWAFATPAALLTDHTLIFCFLPNSVNFVNSVYLSPSLLGFLCLLLLRSF